MPRNWKGRKRKFKSAKNQIYRKAQPTTPDSVLTHCTFSDVAFNGVYWQVWIVLRDIYDTSVYIIPTSKDVKSEIKAPKYIDFKIVRWMQGLRRRQAMVMSSSWCVPGVFVLSSIELASCISILKLQEAK